MSRHSNIVGGSTAGRLLACPGSVKLIASLPEIIDVPSEYATEGTALHAVMAELILDPEATPEKYLNTVITVENEGDVIINHELVHDCLVPAVAFYDEKIADAIGQDDPVLVEQRVKFPGIEGAFGTADLIAFNSHSGTTFITDWKFGAGVAVSATYPDPDDSDYEIVSPQLLFYACAARHSLPHMFRKGGDIVLTIVQPRARDGASVTTVVVHDSDLDHFERALADTVKLALTDTAPIKIGDHCRFAVCKPVCPLHLAPLLDITDLYPIEVVRKPGVTAEVLADILELAQFIEPVITEARKQAQRLLEGGASVPGWKLVPKRANREWAMSEDAVAAALRKLKVKKPSLYETKFKSVAQVEKLLPKGEKMPEVLVARNSSGKTLARADDARPEATNEIGAAVADVVGLLDRSYDHDDQMPPPMQYGEHRG